MKTVPRELRVEVMVYAPPQLSRFEAIHKMPGVRSLDWKQGGHVGPDELTVTFGACTRAQFDAVVDALGIS